MQNEINYYLTEFKTIFNGEPWYGRSLMDIIRNADTAKVHIKPSPDSHSAYEILEHMFAWRNLFVKRLNGDHDANIKMNSTQDWSEYTGSVAAWKELLGKMEKNQDELLTALAKHKDEEMDQPFAGTQYSLRVFCNGHVQHDIYHIGQIALLLK